MALESPGLCTGRHGRCFETFWAQESCGFIGRNWFNMGLWDINGIIWLIINRYGVWLLISGCWLTYPSEKWWSSSVGIMKSPTEWKNKKCSKAPTRINLGNTLISIPTQCCISCISWETLKDKWKNSGSTFFSLLTVGYTQFAIGLTICSRQSHAGQFAWRNTEQICCSQVFSNPNSV